ncbi:hypothetical protein [Pectobacterium aroidearum]|uniref:hypothetical protein n=1 Tax=Pectobacterium aroidearum TaxID=1201031 RepID=UPI0026144137|nr:hypothetical protein [Pectobacterium aroidearum]WKA61364.1 hypothetical protein QX495_15355 [Pectobacterium aroidearum]
MNWQPVVREVHLLGGGRAFNGINPEVEIHPLTINKKLLKIHLKDYHHLFHDINKAGLYVIGCDFFTTPESVNGYTPPQWRTKNKNNPIWLCAEEGDNWSFIAHSAFKQKNGLLCDIAARISHQLRACEWRLRQLSESYANQLNSRIHSNKFTDNQLFLDEYTSLAYLSLQSFLVDACVLRDYLAEFYSEVTSSEENNGHIGKVTTLSGLIKRWKITPPKNNIGNEILISSKPGQWLFELGSYRDLVVHVAPLATAGRTLCAVTKTFDLIYGESIPGIKLPLPNNPDVLQKERSSGRYFNDPELNFARFKNIIDNIDNTKDSLEYAHSCMQLLGKMAKSVSTLSPVKPEMPLITQNDIIGNIIIK